jgi:hypothetical protein
LRLAAGFFVDEFAEAENERFEPGAQAKQQKLDTFSCC